MIRDSLADVLAALDRAFALFESRGLAAVAQHSRFAQHHRILADTIKLFKDIEGEEWRRAEAVFVSEQRLTPYSAALTESHELADLIPYIEASPSDIITSKLKDILSGPQHGEDETPTSAHARNTLFELNIAARLWRSGLIPELGAGADVRCEVGGKRLLIECKRPYASSGLPRAIRDARRQLRTAFRSEPPGTRGIIAVSLTRLLTRGHKFFRVADEQAATVGLKSVLTDTAMSHQSAWRHLPGSIITVLFHAIAMMDVTILETYITAQGTAMFTLARPGSLDAKISELLHKRFEAASY